MLLKQGKQLINIHRVTYMKKTLIIAFIVIVLGAVAFIISSRTKSDALVVVPSNEITPLVTSDIETASLPQVNQTGETLDASVSFVGYGPGKQHTGSFGKVTSTVVDDGQSLSGTVTVDMMTLTSDSDKLTDHLKSADFFDVTSFPSATFTITSSTPSSVTGNLTVHGITKSVTIPYEMTSTGYTSTFTMDMSEFGIEQTFANEEVTITITLR